MVQEVRRLQAIGAKRIALIILAAVLPFMVANVALLYLLDFIVRRVILEEDKPALKQEEQLKKDVTAALDALQKDAGQAILLLARLQGEIDARSKTIREIEQKIEILQLTPRQREAIKDIQQQRSLKDLLTSTDFWIGAVAVSAFFFVLERLVPGRSRQGTPDDP